MRTVSFEDDYIIIDDDDDDDDEGQINFSVALSPKTTRTRNNKPKQWSHVKVVSGCLIFVTFSIALILSHLHRQTTTQLVTWSAF